MFHLKQALALHDIASEIERVRVQLRALSANPITAPPKTVSGLIRTLAHITNAIGGEIDNCLASAASRVATKQIVVTYGSAVGRLGVAMTAMGRLQRTSAQFEFGFREGQKARAAQRAARPRMIEIKDECCADADEALEEATDELFQLADRLSAPQGASTAAARARSSHLPKSGQHLPATGVPAPVTPPATQRSR